MCKHTSIFMIKEFSLSYSYRSVFFTYRKNFLGGTQKRSNLPRDGKRAKGVRVIGFTVL